jgi:hypothetical protein
MNSVLDDSLVAVALLVSVGYALSSLGPRGLRRRALAALSRMLAHAPAALGLQRLSQRLDAAAAGKAKGACGGCDSCATDASAAKSAPEVRVPVAKIGRRG